MNYVKTIQTIGQNRERRDNGTSRLQYIFSTIFSYSRSQLEGRATRYQDFSSIQVDSDNYDKVKSKGVSLSVKAENHFIKPSQFKQANTVVASRNGRRPMFFVNQAQKQTIDYSSDMQPQQNGQVEQDFFRQTGRKNNFFIKDFNKKRTNEEYSMEPRIKNKWLDSSLDASLNIQKQQNGPFASLNASTNIYQKEEQTDAKNDQFSQSLISAKQYIQERNFVGAVKLLQSVDSDNLEARFLLSYSLLNINQNEQSIQVLEDILKVNNLYRKEVFLFLGLAYMNLKRCDKARVWLERCVKSFPTYSEAYLQLGQINFKLDQFQSAINHLNTSIRIKSDLSHPYMLKIDCFLKLKQYPRALEQFDQIQATFPKLRNQLSFQIKYAFTLLKKKITSILRDHPSNGEALYLKGLIQYKKSQLNDSVLTFEQALHTNCASRISSKCVYHIAKVKIEQKDFYAAQHQITRFDLYNNPNFAFFQRIKGFIDGTIALMKRQFKVGLEHYQKFINNEKLSNFIKPIFYLYQGYGHFCLSQYQNVLADYKTMIDQGIGLNISALYNQAICEGLLAANKNNFDQAFEKMNKAHKLLPERMDPFFYKACLTLTRAFASPNEQMRQKAVEESSVDIENAFQTKGKSSNLYYVRALVKSYNHRFSSAIKDLDKAIDKSEDNIVEHFFLRGTLQAQQMRLKQAIKDFTTCVHFNKEFFEAYLERAKCYQITGDQEKAFQDLKRYISLRDKDPYVHYWAGSLLFHNNAYEESLRAYSECQQTKDVQILIVKCHLKQQELDLAHEQLASMVRQYGSDQRLKIDHELVGIIRRIVEFILKKNKAKIENNQSKENAQILQNSLDSLDRIAQITHNSQDNFGYLFNLQNYQLHKGVVLCLTKNYQKAITEFEKLEGFWSQKHQQRLQQQSQPSQVINTEESEQVQNEMILKSERIIQHIIAIKYNMILSHFMVQQYKQAQDQCKQIKQLIENVQSEEINYLLDLATAFIEGRTPLKFPRAITFLISESSLFNYYPLIRIPLSNNSYIDCKLSISIPDIQPPNICPTFSNKLMESITPALVENRPEAPWIKRENKTILFTDNIFYVDDLNLQTEQDEEKPNKLRSDTKLFLNILDDKEKLKEVLQLDEKIKNKLNKILNSPKEISIP